MIFLRFFAIVLSISIAVKSMPGEEDQNKSVKKVVKRERCPVITKTEEAILIQLLSRSNPLSVADRDKQTKNLYKKISMYRLSVGKIFDPCLRETRTRLTIGGRIILCKEEIDQCVRYYYEKTGNDGAKKLFHLIKQHYYGIGEPTIQRALNNIEQQQRKCPKFQNKAPLRPILASSPMQRHQIDLVDLRATPVKTKKASFLYVLSVLDVFSRYLWLRALHDKTPATVAKKLTSIYRDFGPPKYLQCDQGSEFKGLVKELCQAVGIKLIYSSSSHLQSQGKIERSHQQWKDKIRNKIANTVFEDEPYNWVDDLPALQQTYNEGYHRVIAMTPYECLFGIKSNRQLLGSQTASLEAFDSDTCTNTGIKPHLEFVKKLRETATNSNRRVSIKKVNRGLAKHPPSKYKVGEEVFVKNEGKGMRLRRGQSVIATKVIKGTVIETNYDQFKYKVRILNDKQKPVNKWFHVNKITSVTRREEIQRKVKPNNNANKCKCNRDVCNEMSSEKCSNQMHANCCVLYGKAACVFHIIDCVDFLTRISILEKYTTITGTSSDYDNLMRNSLQYGLLERGTTPTDGNCLFHCLAVQLSTILNRPIFHDIVRREVVNYLRENPFAGDGTHLQTFVSGNDWENYLARMASNNEWGDHLVLYGAANLYSVGIMIVSSLGEESTQFMHSTLNANVNDRHLILLGHLSEHHYISLQPISRHEDENIHVLNSPDLAQQTYTQPAAELEDIIQSLTNEILQEHAGDGDNNSLNLMAEGRNFGTPVAVNNARIHLFLKQIKQNGKNYKFAETEWGQFCFIPEDDMDLFERKDEYMDSTYAYRLLNERFRYWFSVQHGNTSSVAELSNEIVQMPHDLANEYDTWLEQMKFNIRQNMVFDK